jgi:hypothetical protein
MALNFDKQLTAFVPDRAVARTNWRRTVSSSLVATAKDAKSMPDLVKLWYEHCREEPIRMGDLAALAEKVGLMPHVLRKSKIQAKGMRLSHLISANRGPYDGLTIVPVEATGSSRCQWRLKRITAPTTYTTTFCNADHRLEDGRPIGHGCYVIPPKLLKLERGSSDFFRDQKAVAEWREWEKLGNKREYDAIGVKAQDAR